MRENKWEEEETGCEWQCNILIGHSTGYFIGEHNRSLCVCAFVYADVCVCLFMNVHRFSPPCVHACVECMPAHMHACICTGLCACVRFPLL